MNDLNRDAIFFKDFIQIFTTGTEEKINTDFYPALFNNLKIYFLLKKFQVAGLKIDRMDIRTVWIIIRSDNFRLHPLHFIFNLIGYFRQ